MAFNTNGAATAGPKGLFSIDPLDVRLQVKTKAALADIKAGTVYESIHVFCQEDKKFYTPKNYSTTAADANVEWEEVKYSSDIATTTTAGIVKPDGTTITVDTDGKITAEATKNTNESVENGVVYDWIGTLEEYEALETHDDNKVYFITDDDEDTRHNQLWGRSEKNAHPISAITGLEEALANSTASVNLKEGYGIDIQYPSRLPTGYTQLEYVESTGGQFVDTGVIYTSGDNVKIKYQFLEYKNKGSSGDYIFGICDQTLIPPQVTNSHCFLRISPPMNTNLEMAGCCSGTTTLSSRNDTHIHTYEIVVNKPYFDGKEINNGGTVITFYNPDTPLDSMDTVGLFGAKVNNWPTPTTYENHICTVPMRIYEFEIEGKCKLVPAKTNDGVIGFYDLISEAFITTEEAMTLVGGPELDSYKINALIKASDDKLVNIEYDYVMPEGYTRLEYLENNGQQYIDTQVNLYITDTIRAKVYLETIKMNNQSAGVFGASYLAGSGYLQYGNGLELILGVDPSGSNFSYLVSNKSPMQHPSTGQASVCTDPMVTAYYPYGTYNVESSSNVYYIDSIKKQNVQWYIGVGDPRTRKTENTVKLFAFDEQRNDSHNYHFGNGKGIRIYSYKHYDYLNTPKVIMYPAKRNSDGALGMYDFVNNVFRTNANVNETESFIAGPELTQEPESATIISTNLKFGAGLEFQNASAYDGVTGHKELAIDSKQVLKLRATSGTGTIYNELSSAYPGNESSTYMTVIGQGNTTGTTGSTLYGYGSHGSTYCTAVGCSSYAAGVNSVAVGFEAKTGEIIGASAKISDESIAIGHSASITNISPYSIAIGCKAKSSNSSTVTGGGYGISIGYNAQASSFSTAYDGTIAIGKDTLGAKSDVIIGRNAQDEIIPSTTSTATTNGENTIVGANAKIHGDYSVVVGYNAMANGRTNVAIGLNSIAGYDSTTNWDRTHVGSIAVGYAAKSTGEQSICVGTTDFNDSDYSKASGNRSVAIGYKAQATGPTAIQLGQGTNGDTKSLHVYEYELFDGMTGKIPLARLYTLSGATAADDGDAGIVPQPNAGDQNKYLRGDGTWQTINTATSLTALTDTDINNPQDNHALVYSSAQGKWVNKKAGVEATYDATNFRITFA